MKSRKSILIALALAGLAALWIASGQVGSDNGQNSKPESTTTADNQAAPAVRVAESAARPRRRTLTVTGRSEASRRVDLRAETPGQVSERQVERGDKVTKGSAIASLRLDDRRARLSEAVALLKQREIENEAARKLHEKGFRSTTAQAAAEAQLDAARAVVEQIEIDITRTQIRAPFAGIVGTGHVEPGDYVRVGDTVATIVDLDPILVVGNVSERQIGSLKNGDSATVRLIDGAVVQGRISFIAPVADKATRTYRVEIRVANPDYGIRDGLTAEITFALADIPAHFVPPSALTLNDAGTVGVRIVGADDIVGFIPVTVLEDAADGVWLTGLPDRVRLIVVGQEFVTEGEHVTPVSDSTAGRREPTS